MEHPAPGEHWGQREKPRTLGVPLQPVEVLQLGPDGSNRVRVRWLSGEYEGMDQWVRLTTLVVPWDVAEAVMADERALLELRRHAPTVDPLQWEAAQHVLDHLRLQGETYSTEIALGMNADEGVVWLETEDDALEHLELSSSDLQGYQAGFIDRDGDYVGPWELGLKVVRNLARRHGDQLVTSLRRERRAYRQAAVTGWYGSPFGGRGWEIGAEAATEHLREMEALHGTILEWAEAPAQIEEWSEVEALREEISRLRRLVEQTARWLRERGHPQKAAMVRRDLQELDADARL